MADGDLHGRSPASLLEDTVLAPMVRASPYFNYDLADWLREAYDHYQQRAREPGGPQRCDGDTDVQFPLDEPIPYALIGRIVKLRVKQELAKAAVKRNNKSRS